MGLFKDIYCSECGQKTKMLFRTQLCDESYLCSKCTSCVPFYMENTFNEKYSLGNYHEFKEYVKDSNDILRPMFHETHSFETFHLDSENGIFYIGSGINDNTLFLKLACVTRFDMVFQAENFKEGVLGDKVTGKILFELAMDMPYFYYQGVLTNNAKAKAKKKLFGNKVEFDNPSGMDEFMYYFSRAWEVDHAKIKYEDDTDAPSDAPSELQQAMALFMLDSLNGTTLEDLKNLRNKLIKTFHPDSGDSDNTKYAQKINMAYETIRKALE